MSDQFSLLLQKSQVSIQSPASVAKSVAIFQTKRLLRDQMMQEALWLNALFEEMVASNMHHGTEFALLFDHGNRLIGYQRSDEQPIFAAAHEHE